MTSGDTRRQGSPRLLSPLVLQVTGLVLLVGTALFWGATGRESALFVGAALTLIGVGSYERTVARLLERLRESPNGGSR